VRDGQERLQLGVHAARLVEAAQSLLRLSELLKRDALLSDFSARLADTQAAQAAGEARLAAALEALREDGEAAAPSERVARLPAGDVLLYDDLDAPLDALTAQLYAVARADPPAASLEAS